MIYAYNKVKLHKGTLMMDVIHSYKNFIVDSHCHLNLLKQDITNVLQKARDHDVKFCMTINTCLEDTPLLISLTERYDHLCATVGIHPCSAHESDLGPENLYQTLDTHTQHPKIVGLGETGLDYYHNDQHKIIQQEFFMTHLALGATTDLPLVIHTRSADDDTLLCVKKHPKARGVFHCFTGTLDFAKKALDLGYYLSFSGIITFKNATALHEVVRYTPIDRLLIETDSPYLAPAPHRGKENEPAFTHYVAQKVAEIKQIPFEALCALTTQNYFTLFNKAATHLNEDTL